MMRRLGAALAAVLALSGCGLADILDLAPAPDQGVPIRTAAPPPGPTLAVLPDSAHVTDRTHIYPTTCHARRVADGGVLPDARCTPGSVISADQAAVCADRFKDDHQRPPTAETTRFKRTAMAAYGSTQTARRTELDHLVPKWAAGSNDASNLWPQPSDLPGADWQNSKDKAETAAKAALCRPGSRLTLAQVQNAFAVDWTTADTMLGIA